MGTWKHYEIDIKDEETLEVDCLAVVHFKQPEYIDGNLQKLLMIMMIII